MNKKEFVEAEAAFYQKCSEILGVEHTYKERVERMTRWNNRRPGNGRFLGVGLIRFYSPSKIHICLTAPPLNVLACSEQEALKLLSEIHNKSDGPERQAE
jgi:hypothetical protein